MTYTHFPNSDEHIHCVQTCIQTLLDHNGLNVPTISELDVLTGHLPGKFTWMSKAMVWLASLGFKIINIEDIDYSEFAVRGSEYLRTIYSKEVFDLQNSMSDLAAEQMLAKQLVNHSSIHLLKGRIDIETMRMIIRSGYTAFVSVNPYTLDAKPGMSSHMVVVTDIDSPHVIGICDPDRGFRQIPTDIFSEAVHKDDYSMTFFLRAFSKERPQQNRPDLIEQDN